MTSSSTITVGEIADQLSEHTETLVRRFLPHGRPYKDQWLAGDVTGAPGESLKVHLSGDHAGKWKDFATDESGDLLDLWCITGNLTKGQAVTEAKKFLGIHDQQDTTTHTKPPTKPKPVAKAISWMDRVIEASVIVEKVARSRGYRPEFVEWLRKENLLGVVNGDPAFPVHHDGKVVSAHVRRETKPGDRQRWEYVPPLGDLGISLTPLVIGELATAKQIFIFESQWDAFAFADVLGWEKEPQNAAMICTRGTSCVMPEGGFPQGVPVYAVMQNDPPRQDGSMTPAQMWLERVRKSCSGHPVYTVLVPEKHKDANDWTRAGATTEEVRLAIDSATRMRKSRLSVRSVAEILDMEFDDSDNYFGDRIIAAGQQVVIAGPGGVGKSRLLLYLAVCMITGRPFLDMDTHAKGKTWLIIQTENSNRRLHADLKRMLLGLRLFADESKLINQCLHIHTVEDDFDTFLDLENPESLAQIEGLVEDYNPDFVVFDPLNTMTALDLNSDRDMRLVTSQISRSVKKGNPQRVPVVVHHSLTGKAGAARAIGFDKASYARNSKVLYNWTRSQINLAPRDAEDNTLLFMSCGKNNNGKPFPDMGLVYSEQKGVYMADPDFDADEFREAVGVEKNKTSITIKPEAVAGLFTSSIDRSDLVKKIMATFSCKQRRAYKAIEGAEESGTIKRRSKGNYNVEFFKP